MDKLCKSITMRNYHMLCVLNNFYTIIASFESLTSALFVTVVPSCKQEVINIKLQNIII